MGINFRWVWPALLGLAAQAPAATDIQATLDQSKIVIAMNVSTALRVTLHNGATTPVYLTGLELSFSDGIEASIYDPDLFKQQLSVLGAGDSWDGPLVVVRPTRRGPLLVKGVMHLKGGPAPAATQDLASIPLFLTVNDPRRQVDGSYDSLATPDCDRKGPPCCERSEPSCSLIGQRCIYIAEGYARQNLCVDKTADKTYDRIFDLHVSTDGRHIAYLAGVHCLVAGPEERCDRLIVVDHAEWQSTGIPSQLQLSPDGRHIAYARRTQCVWREGKEACSGPLQRIVDGNKVDQWPAWYKT